MRYLILLSALVAFASVSLAQPITQQQQLQDRIRQIRERELADPTKARRWKYGDAYERLVALRAMHELGIPITKKNSAIQEAQANEKDTVLNISKNVQSQNETTISINRKNKKLIVAAANDDNMLFNGMPVYRTTNSGKNWSTRRVEPPEGYLAIGDPILTSNNDGRFFYSFLMTPFSAPYETTSIGVAKSLDGATWELCTQIGEGDFFEDKEMIVTDLSPTSPYYGRVYVIWNRFELDFSNSYITLAASSNQGTSWKLTEQIVTNGTHPVVKIGRNGEVIIGSNPVVYDEENETYTTTHLVMVSTDGGETFDEVLNVPFEDYPLNQVGRSSLKGDAGFRASPYMSFDVDLKTGMLHFISGSWSGEAAQMFYRSSSDMGNSWSQPKMIGIANPASNDEEKDRFFPWVTVDQTTGEAYVLYYSSENDPGNLMTTVKRQLLTPEMNTHPRAVATTEFDPSLVDFEVGGGIPFIGDYIGSDAHDSIYAACWTAVQTGRSDGEVFAYISLPGPKDSTTTSVKPTVIYGDRPIISWISPNPSAGTHIHAAYYTPQASEVQIELLSLDGKSHGILKTETVEAGASIVDLQLPSLANGTYFLKMTSPAGIAEGKFILSR